MLKNFEKFKEKARTYIEPNDYGIFVSQDNIFRIERPSVFIGRASPKCHPDIDLSEYQNQDVSREHCLLTLCSDRNFYLEVISRDVIVNTKIFIKAHKYV